MAYPYDYSVGQRRPMAPLPQAQPQQAWGQAQGGMQGMQGQPMMGGPQRMMPPGFQNAMPQGGGGGLLGLAGMQQAYGGQGGVSTDQMRAARAAAGNAGTTYGSNSLTFGGNPMQQQNMGAVGPYGQTQGNGYAQSFGGQNYSNMRGLLGGFFG